MPDFWIFMIHISNKKISKYDVMHIVIHLGYQIIFHNILFHLLCKFLKSNLKHIFFTNNVERSTVQEMLNGIVSRD
jgi:hypothetical protein